MKRLAENPLERGENYLRYPPLSVILDLLPPIKAKLLHDERLLSSKGRSSRERGRVLLHLYRRLYPLLLKQVEVLSRIVCRVAVHLCNLFLLRYLFDEWNELSRIVWGLRSRRDPPQIGELVHRPDVRRSLQTHRYNPLSLSARYNQPSNG